MASNETANADASMLHGTDIANVLSSAGPIVKCVLLKAGPPPDESQKPAATSKGDDDIETTTNADTTTIEASNNVEERSEVREHDDVQPESREILVALMEEIEIDTTPSKSMVAKTLGGPFTFLGQYEDEGIVLMIRKQEEENDEDSDGEDDVQQKQPLRPSHPFDREASNEQLKGQSVKDLRKLCGEREIPTEAMLEKGDLIEALLNDMELRHEQEAKLRIVNPHQLQPPLHNVKIRGDILVMKVAATEETLDDEDEDGEDNDDSDEQGASKEKEIVVPSNDEFFLDYTKDEYIEFASRTDIVEPEEDDEEESSDEEGSEDEADAEEADAYMFGEDGEPDEQDKNAMLNMVMNEVLRQFREDNGRGPDTLELLEIRSTIAKQLEIEMPEVDEVGADWSQKAKKDDGSKKRDRRIAFSPDTKSGAPLGPVNDDEDDDEDEDYMEGSAKKKPRIETDGDDNDDAIQK